MREKSLIDHASQVTVINETKCYSSLNCCALGLNCNMDNLTIGPNVSTDSFVIWQEYQDDIKLMFAIIALILSVLIIISNCLTLVVLLKGSPLPPQTTRLLISLTLADLLVGICLPGDFIQNGYCEYFKVKNRFCKDFDFINIQLLETALICSVLNTFIVAVDRYVSIFKPLRYHSILTSSRVTKMQLITWIFPIVYTSTYYIWWSDNPAANSVPHVFRLPIAFAGYCAIGIFLCCVYIRIILLAKRHTSRIQQLETVSNTDTDIAMNHISQRRTIKTNNMLLYCIAAYLLAWSPLLIMYCIWSSNVISKGIVIVEMLGDCAQTLGYANSGWNIIVYIGSHNAMRKAYRDTICFWK